MKQAIATISLALAAQLAGGEPIPTPVATKLTAAQATDSELLYAVTVPSNDPHANWGWLVTCNRTTGDVSARFSFGAFPGEARQLQTAIQDGNGEIHRFGPVFRSPGPASGYHDPEFDDPAVVAEIVDAAFSTGALVSNGYNSVWNNLSPEENRKVRDAYAKCATN